MFVRMETGHFKPEKLDFVTRTLEKDVIPLLKKQHGFRDELSFFDDKEKQLNAISFWETRNDLEKYEREVYPTIREKMADAFVAQPKSHRYEVANSTWYKIHAA